jgi:hypothetical protein
MFKILNTFAALEHLSASVDISRTGAVLENISKQWSEKVHIIIS